MSVIDTIPFPDRQFSITEAAEYLRISRTHFYSLIQRNVIRPVRIGDRPIVSGAELQRALAVLAEPATERHSAAQ